MRNGIFLLIPKVVLESKTFNYRFYKILDRTLNLHFLFRTTFRSGLDYLDFLLILVLFFRGFTSTILLIHIFINSKVTIGNFLL